MSAGLKTVIFLSFVLAAGFLLVILSCALWNNWLPLLVAFTFYNSAYVDFGRFLTGVLVATGFCLPIILEHSDLIQPGACWMSIAGGLLVYGTILVYSGWFGQDNDDDAF
ncbi:hypothetical protein CcaverHIS002_0408820 [Cutaneotrichosporon cavernicola]|nr:hypothetical protein CcaverHIS002_0408820 [Cutaneotrichosporon cavernicola]